ncbi:MAG: hypothetical protein IJE88_04250 [Akkermansia sp.]|nr:hypothetical protein [Akkermansia sp.]
MSYDIHITNEQGETLHTAQPLNLYGGTYSPDSTKLWYNITYNYSPFYYRAETLGESTAVWSNTGKGYQEQVQPEKGGIPGLAYLTIPQARERVLKAIQNLRDKPLNKHGKPYQGTTDMPATDYWAPHEANARRALVNLLQLLCLAPDNAKIQIS